MDASQRDAPQLPDDAAICSVLRSVVDPELGVNIVDLGLIYGIERGGPGLRIRMTLTSPGCPMGPLLVDEVREVLARRLPAATPVEVELVWAPVWSAARMSEAARRSLGWGDA